MLNICISNETVTRNLNKCLQLRWITNTNFLNSRQVGQSQKYLLIAVTIVVNITIVIAIVIIIIVVTHITIVITKIITLAILKLQLKVNKDCLLYYVKLVN